MRVVVLGAGYAGLGAALRLAKQVCRHGVAVSVINASPLFVERPRLHQVAARQRVADLPLRDLLSGTGAELLVGRVTGIDPWRREIRVGGRTVVYDRLVYALGSMTDVDSVPGVREHAHMLDGPAAAHLSQTLPELARDRGRLVVCGGGLTGIEAATELAEAYPGLEVVLVSRDEIGAWLSARARAHVHRVFERLGVVRAVAAITEVRAGLLALRDGTSMRFDACLWTGGFRVPALAAESGFAVSDCGRIVVDESLRSVSHPDVYAIGDAAAAAGRWGDSIAYGCRTGGFMGPYVADAIADTLAGRAAKPFRFRYIHQCVSLGRRDAVIQFVDAADESPRRAVLTGWPAVWYKEIVLAGSVWVFRWPGPYLPRRRRPATTAFAEATARAR